MDDGKKLKEAMDDGKKHNQGRRSSLYANFTIPPRPNKGEDKESPYTHLEDSYFPAKDVQHILHSVNGRSHNSHNVFCEMDTLKKYNDNFEWRETARWVKYEEVVEEGGKRWSKPHVASLSMHSILETRKQLMEGLLVLDIDVHTVPELVDSLIENWIDDKMLDSKLRQHIRYIMLAKHKHSHNPRPKAEKDIYKKREYSQSKIKKSESTQSVISESDSTPDITKSPSMLSFTSMARIASSVSIEGLETQDYKPNSAFMRKIPKDSEVCNIMVGEVIDLKEPIFAFVRLKEARMLEGISEVQLPTRFVAFVFAPQGTVNAKEIGRCIATMMTDDVFRKVAYKGRSLSDIIVGLDEFVEQVTVLPPSAWDRTIRIEPPQKVQSQEHRTLPPEKRIVYETDEGGHGDDPALQMSKIPFSGLVNDIKRKLPWYWSDYKDCLHIQCFAAFVYVFLGTFTPNVTFGGLLGQATDQYMGVMECIFAAAVTGILFAMFGGQPLNILGSTGPMLVLEAIIYSLCKDNDWDFMPARCWIGLWTAGFLLIIVIFNLSALVKYITRFTEESFASLIAIIFIVEAFKKLMEIETDSPINTEPEKHISTNCTCIAPVCNGVTTVATTLITGVSTVAPNSGHNLTTICANISSLGNITLDWSSFLGDECNKWGGEPLGDGCFPPHFEANVFFLSVLLFLGTFGLSLVLKDFRSATIFPSTIRSLTSDFAVLISIVVFVVVDILIGVPTPKLIVPDEFKPTRDDRGWFINPVSDKNPWWLAIAAALPAILAVILIFLDQQITAVIVNRKENKLKKGVGYHLDLLVVAITVAIHSLLGLPWYVAATVSAIAHINSLKKESECTAPGEKPTFLGCREQRVTALAIGILSGAAVFITNVLKVIPMPVLYGVFLFMGYSALRGIQLVDRLYLVLQPVKYQPDLLYLRHVQLYRVHIFTVIQVLCLGVLWAVKSVKIISIGFPIMVLATGIVRKLMEYFFTQYELKYLDDLLPGKHAEKPNDTEMAIGKINVAYDDDSECKPNSKEQTNGLDENKTVFFLGRDSEKRKNVHLYNDGSKASTHF